MITKELKTSLSEKNSELEKTVRNDVKSLFDKKPNNDPLYQVYDTIDKVIASKFSDLDTKEEETKRDILRIVEFFNTFHFFESINDFIRDAYINYNHFRRGFLSNGVLLRTQLIDGQLKFNRGYTIPELVNIYNEQPKLYSSILNEIKGELEGFISIDSGEKWYFWPGCEMKIPISTNIVLDTSIAKSKFVISKKDNTSIHNNKQIVLEEKPYQLELSVLMDTDFFYKKTENNKQKLTPGFFTINKSDSEQYKTLDFSEIELELQNGEKYDYTLYMPYSSPRLDVKTNMKIFDTNKKVEEFIATCS
ncbi:hypothetical protein M0D21_06290 [Aquimarina sp. D1M17]|uniref:hypothetical protein n=1 Tax=Aquimarina acroporae TaxID=2937283 RepID=UPI0020C10906|nr:hypothetical protein [Aquimarina acroporae]MCK8521166.1 hypothetical protein [Aquimarina acroporae]